MIEVDRCTITVPLRKLNELPVRHCYVAIGPPIVHLILFNYINQNLFQEVEKEYSILLNSILHESM